MGMSKIRASQIDFDPAIFEEVGRQITLRDSGAATAGYALVADGSGGTSWSAIPATISDHDALNNLDWTAAAHTGASDSLAGWDGSGNPQVVAKSDFEQIANKGVAGGYASLDGGALVPTAQLPASLVYEEDDATRLGSGAASSGQVLTADGTGGASWTAASGVSDHDALSNLAWTSALHTGANDSLAGWGATGAPQVVAKSTFALAADKGVAGGYAELDGSALVPASQLPTTILFDDDDATRLGSGAASGGQVLTADGAGGTFWTAVGGGVTDHDALDNLEWTVAAHTGVADSLAGWDGAGNPEVVEKSTFEEAVNKGQSDGYASLDSSATVPVDQLPSTLIYEEDDAARLGSGVAVGGQVLTADGTGGVSWTAASGVSDHDALTNLGWTVAAHTGSANGLAGWGGSGEAVVVPQSTFEVAANKGAINGYASLNGAGLVPTGELPASLVYEDDNATRLGSGSATTGHVLTADGAGGTDWAEAGVANWEHTLVQTVDSPFTPDGQKVVFVDASAGDVQIILPDPGGLESDYALWVQRVDGSDNTVTLQPAMGTLHGEASRAVEAQDDVYFLATRGADWQILSHQPGGGLVQSDVNEIEVADFTAGVSATEATGWTDRLPHHHRHGVVVTVDLTDQGGVTELSLKLMYSGKADPTAGTEEDWAAVRADDLDRASGQSLTQEYTVKIPVSSPGRYSAVFPVPAAAFVAAKVWASGGDAAGSAGRVYMQRWVN